VARELAPAGLRSGPKPCNRDRSDKYGLQVLRLLRSRAGASSLATVLMCAGMVELEPSPCECWLDRGMTMHHYRAILRAV